MSLLAQERGLKPTRSVCRAGPQSSLFAQGRGLKPVAGVEHPNRKEPILAERTQPEPPPEPSGREKSAIQDSKDRVKNRRLRVSLKFAKRDGDDRTLEIHPRHS